MLCQLLRFVGYARLTGYTGKRSIAKLRNAFRHRPRLFTFSHTWSATPFPDLYYFTSIPRKSSLALSDAQTRTAVAGTFSAPRLLDDVHSGDNARMQVRRVLPFFILTFCLSAGQDPHSVDLTVSPLVASPAEFIGKKVPPTGCSEISDGGSADGIVQAEDGEPRDILVEIEMIAEV